MRSIGEPMHLAHHHGDATIIGQTLVLNRATFAFLQCVINRCIYVCASLTFATASRVPSIGLGRPIDAKVDGSGKNLAYNMLYFVLRFMKRCRGSVTLEPSIKFIMNSVVFCISPTSSAFVCCAPFTWLSSTIITRKTYMKINLY